MQEYFAIHFKLLSDPWECESKQEKKSVILDT